MIGRKIANKFLIEEEIGSGGMGTVFRARQIDLDKDVAIKVLRESLAKEQEYTSRFKREAKAASKIDHPNSMRVIDFGQEPDGTLYIAMELLDGRSLHDIIKEEAPLPAARVIDLTRQILAALAAAHDMDVLHRDLKPENIIVVRKRADEGHEREIVKVCDFGIAKIQWGSAATATPSNVTGAGTIVGTPDYMSPEQARGLVEVDVRSDLYSVGVMMYQMLTGTLPFVANTPLGVVLMQLNEQPKPLREVEPSVDPRLEEICLRALAKDPSERYASARAMRAALALGDVAPESIPIAPSSKRKLKLVVDASATGQTATSMTAPSGPVRPPMQSAKDLLAEPEIPKRGGIAPLAILAVLLLGGGVWYALGARTVDVTTDRSPATPTAPAPSHTPSAVASGNIESPVPSASAVTSASASASASASGATSAAAPATTGVAVAPPTVIDSGSSAPAASSNAPQGPPSPLHVVVGAVSAEHLNVATLTGALPVSRFERCYRDGVAPGAKAPIGGAKLHISMNATSIEASFAGPPELASIGGCVVNAANRMAIDVPPGGATADIDLGFKSD